MAALYTIYSHLSKSSRENPHVCSDYSHMRKGPFIKPMRYGGYLSDLVFDIPRRLLPKKEESFLVKAVKKSKKKNIGDSFIFWKNLHKYSGEIVDINTFKLLKNKDQKYLRRKIYKRRRMETQLHHNNLWRKNKQS